MVITEPWRSFLVRQHAPWRQSRMTWGELQDPRGRGIVAPVRVSQVLAKDVRQGAREDGRLSQSLRMTVTAKPTRPASWGRKTMRGRHHRFRPIVEPVEGRALLSGGLAVASSAHAMLRQRDSVTVPLNGSLRGFYDTTSVSPDAGTSYVFTGVNVVQGFGLASGVGEILTPRPGVEGYAEGNLSLISQHGVLKMNLTALEPQNGTQGIANEYSYQITLGRGRFFGAKGGTGSATLTLIQKPIHHSGYSVINHRFVLSLKAG